MMIRNFVLLSACAMLSQVFAFTTSPLPLRSTNSQMSTNLRVVKKDKPTSLKMGLFDGISEAFKNALKNEDLPPPPPDGLSQDAWLGGIRKGITIKFYKDGALLGETEALPGEKLVDVANRAKVELQEDPMLFANDFKSKVAKDTCRIPSPLRSNAIAEDQLMNTGLTAPVFTSFTSRGEVRVEEVQKYEYSVLL